MRPQAKLPRHPSGRPDWISWEETVSRGEHCDSTVSTCGRFEILTHWEAGENRLGLIPSYELIGHHVAGRQLYASFGAASIAAARHT